MRVLIITLTLFIISGLVVKAQDPEERPDKQIVQNRSNHTDSYDKPYVIMVSLDGFRYDYAEKYNAQNLLAMAEKGFSVEQLIPSYPTKTFPNHYSLVTGMYPSSHGLVSNEYFNPEKKQYYKVSNREVVEDGSWYGGTPLWVLAEQQGMLSASYFWVGSEADIQGIHPNYHYKYDGSVPNEKRVDQVLSWLDLPESERPHLLMLYFSLTDDVGHAFGPDSEQIKDAVIEIDGIIGRLRNGISESNLPVNLIVTSDHGMVNARRPIRLRSVDFGNSAVSKSMPLMVYQQDSSEVYRIYEDLKEVANITVYLKQDIPESLNFNNHDNIGQIIAITEPPYVISDRFMLSAATHGFNPVTVTEMNTIFYAEGPNIKMGRIPSARNVDVFPLVRSILCSGSLSIKIDLTSGNTSTFRADGILPILMFGP
ncbi:MAG: ectonucleotide pyrophosphatase/phosphodiesterase, partial [Bacteroidota bacterium]